MDLAGDKDKLAIAEAIINHVNGLKPGIYAEKDLEALADIIFNRGNDLSLSSGFKPALPFFTIARELLEFCPNAPHKKEVILVFSVTHLGLAQNLVPGHACYAWYSALHMQAWHSMQAFLIVLCFNLTRRQ